MFVCEKCMKEYWGNKGWHLYKSFGSCETCGKTCVTWEFKPSGEPNKKIKAIAGGEEDA